MYKILLLLFVVFTITLGCSNNTTQNETQPEVISVNSDLDEIEFSDIFELHSIIPLETHEKGLIQDLKKIYYTNLGIFIEDERKRIIHFSKKGKFIQTYDHQGKGPGEWIEIFDFDVNPQDSTIIVRSQSKSLFYHINGKFIKEQKEDIILIQEMMRINNSVMAFDLENMCLEKSKMNDEYYKLLIHKDNKDELFCKAIPILRGHIFTTRYARHLCQTMDGFYYIEQYKGNLFEIDKMANVHHAYSIDFENKDFPYNDIKNPEDIGEFSKKYANNIRNIYETKDILFFQYSNGYFPVNIIYSKADKKIVKGNFFEDQVNTLPVTIINYYGDVQNFLSLIEPFDMYEYIQNKEKQTGEKVKMLPGLENVKESDNLILVFYKIKPAFQ